MTRNRTRHGGVQPRMRRYALLSVLALTISACLGTDFSDSVQGQWILQSGAHAEQSLPVLIDHPITMRLDRSQINGVAACNSYGGQYRVASNGNFQLVDGLAVTEMACSPAEVMEAESRYLEALLQVNRIEIANSVLTLSGNGYTLTFALDPDAPPTGSQGQGSDNPDEPVSSSEWFGPETFGSWVLESGTLDGEAIPIFDSHPITFEISERGFGGSVCNEYGFAMPLPEDGSFPEIFSTLMMCLPEIVMESESAYLDALRRFQSATVVDGRLLIVGDGVELVYTPAG